MSSAHPFSPSLRPNSALRYAGHIGRVGALAIALGVGFAVASTPGVAHADETTKSSQTPNSTPPGSTDPTDTTKAGLPNDSRQHRGPERRVLRAFGVGADNPGRFARPHRPTASGRNDDQQSTNDRDRVDGG